MPKILKANTKFTQAQKVRIYEKLDFEKNYMLTSAVKTYPILLICLILSLLFNLDIIVMPNLSTDTVTKVVDVLVQSILIGLFFFMAVVSVGNMLELKGSVMSWKEISVILLIALLQGVFDGWVFLVSFIFVFLTLLYIFFIQGKVANRLEFSELAK